MNQNLINLIASYKKTGQSDEVIRQSLWQLGMIPEMIETHLDYYNNHTAQVNKEINIAKDNKNMKLTLENLYIQSKKAMSALDDMKSDDSLGFSASSAKRIIENCLAQLQIMNDDQTVIDEKIKLGYEIDDTLVNPVLKYTVSENLYMELTQYDWIMPVNTLRNMIAESFVDDKWSYVTAKFANSLTSNSTNAAVAELYESLVDVLIDESNVRHALKTVLVENTWNSAAKSILKTIISEEKSECGEVDAKIFENSSCSVRKTFSPVIVDENKVIYHINGRNFIYNGNDIQEAVVTSTPYLNVLEGLSLLKYEEDKDRFVYYGKNNMVLEYICSTGKINVSDVKGIDEMSIIDINDYLKRCGIFDRQTIGDCEKLVKFFESRDMICELDDNITTIKNDKMAGIFVTVINVNEGVYVNKVNVPLGINKMECHKTAMDACKSINDFMKYDATKILEKRLVQEGEKLAIVMSERNEIKDTLAFLSEKRAQLIQGMQETENNKQLEEALKLIEGEIRKFEKELQESYME